MDISSDEADDWFMESLNTYKDLHVFHLEHPTKVIEWTGDKSICVAGCTSSRSEILELLLPLKLYAGDNQGLCAERDFKVQHGGFSEEPVECLIHIPGTRCVVTSGSSSSTLHIWDIGGDESDVIKRTGVINPKSTSAKCSKIAPGLTEEATVLHGSCINDVQLTQIATGRVLYTVGKESSDSVSGLQFVNACVFLICASNGSLLMGDTRDPLTSHYPLKETLKETSGGLHWCFGMRRDRFQSEPSFCTIARLASSGHMVLSDLRDLQSPFCQTRLNVKHSAPNNDFLNVSWAPVLDSCLSVSGKLSSFPVFSYIKIVHPKNKNTIVINIVDPNPHDFLLWDSKGDVKQNEMFYSLSLYRNICFHFNDLTNFSFKGFDGTVQLYNTTNWSTEAQDPQPIFSHQGHEMLYEAKYSSSQPVVTTHAWHQSRPNTLLSAATDGSIHVWDWVDKNTDR
ncbi:WD repeat-containing protein 73 isoform X1 [Myxocyprinus asiaticus]|uniref:WD repeat-containing protein 73 isoform X1 n=1 Tax=Myxocyprinus asiaticus TaxID=70543 RepID=UPI002223BACF|nr:WD repeat-containing protein 73 isoform X1 [Myxocyprinus asiaticus]